MEREFITMEDFMKKGKFITNEDFGNAAARAMNDGPMAELLKDEPMLTLLLATFTALVTRNLFAEEKEA